MKIDITDTHFLELQKKGYTVDMILILFWLNKNLSLEHLIKDSKRIETLYKTMKRKGLITEEDKLSAIGISLLDFVSKKTNKSLIKPKPEATGFDKWWEIFPKNDFFEVKGKSFGPTRAFKTKKEDCRLLFNKMVLDKLYTEKEIIEATEYDVNLKKIRSFKKRSNQLKFLQNSYTYLYQKSFQGFVGMKIKSTSIVNKDVGSTNI